MRVCHASGSHWAVPDAWSRRLDRLLPHCDVLIATEVTRAQWPAFARPGWGRARQGEIVFMWRLAHSKRRHRVRDVILSRRPYFTGKGGKRTVPAARISLRERGRRRPDDVWGIHYPASVQNGPLWSAKGPRVEAHREASARLRRKAARARARGRRVLVGADVNVDLRRAVWRTRMTAATGLSLCWHPGNLPAHGTLGSDRLVDVVAFSGWGEADTDVIPEPPSPFDHDAVVVTLR